LVGVGPASTSLWTRLSGYVSEHKAVVYTVGAVVIVATAGGIYYISQSTPGSDEPGKEKKSKKDRRKKRY
jgi:import receptor subunit TOM70